MFNIYQHLSSLSFITRQNFERADDILNSFSDTQLKSKQWLVSTLKDYNTNVAPKILILGGWYGSFLVPMLNEHLKPKQIILSDIDPQTVKIASQLHSKTNNVSCIELDADDPSTFFNCDILINTSCEHMNTIGSQSVANPNCLYVLQSCDNTNDPGHINTPIDTNDFTLSTGLSQIIFKGRLNLGHKNRFMVIGYK